MLGRGGIIYFFRKEMKQIAEEVYLFRRKNQKSGKSFLADLKKEV